MKPLHRFPNTTNSPKEAKKQMDTLDPNLRSSDAASWDPLALKGQLQRYAADFGALRRQREIDQSRVRAARADALIRLAAAAELKDNDTGEHVARMGEFSALIAAALGCDAGFCDLMRLASQMHDLGKIGIPDAILQKPGKLTESEWVVMRRHPEIGARLLEGSDDPLFLLAAEVALTHHEKFDGSGYPRGLSGTQIPLSGRIVAVADFFDAVTMDRCYRPAMSDSEAFALLRGGSGAHFSPDVVEAFFRVREAIVEARGRARERARSCGAAGG